MYVGIDVSKQHLDVKGVKWSKVERFKNSAGGIRALIKRLSTEAVALVVMEATGGYERLVAKALAVSGIKCAIMNPRQTAHFSKSLGIRAKTDPVDATVLSLYAEKMRPEASKLLSDDEHELRQLLMRRIQLVEDKTRELNRLEHAEPSVRGSIYAVIRCIRRQIEAVTSKIKVRIKADLSRAAQVELLLSAKGVGEIVAMSFSAFLPELGQLDRKQIAALVGVAPFNRDSGTHVGQRAIAGGRAEIRCLLYMATLSAVRSSAKMKNFYKALLARGKKKKVALVACMRKLLVCLNAMLKANTQWREAQAA